jgi:hypothetical protein
VSRYVIDLPMECDDAPEPGDIIRKPRVDHEVLDVWPTESRIWPNRWTLVTRSLGPHDDRPRAGRRLWPTVPYRRGEGPADVFGAA